LIQILDARPWSPSYQISHKFGNVLDFPVSLVAGQSHRLAFQIARTLAQALRYATRAHWRLVNQLIERPLDRWERQQRARVTDTARNKKLDILEAEYLRAYESEMAQIIRRWGLEELAPAIGDTDKEREKNEE